MNVILGIFGILGLNFTVLVFRFYDKYYCVNIGFIFAQSSFPFQPLWTLHRLVSKIHLHSHLS